MGSQPRWIVDLNVLTCVSKSTMHEEKIENAAVFSPSIFGYRWYTFATWTCLLLAKSGAKINNKSLERLRYKTFSFYCRLSKSNLFFPTITKPIDLLTNCLVIMALDLTTFERLLDSCAHLWRLTTLTQHAQYQSWASRRLSKWLARPNRFTKALPYGRCSVSSQTA